MPKQLFVSHVSDTPQKMLRTSSADVAGMQWMFFCQDYVKFLKWKDAFPERFRLIKLEQELSDAAQDLSKPFTDLITRLGRYLASPAWWASRISEKNTAVSFLFLYCCYLHIFQQKIRTCSDSLCIVGEDWALLESMERQAKKEGWVVNRVSRKNTVQQGSLFLLKVISRIFNVIQKAVLGKIAGSATKPGRVGLRNILIHSYVNEACFAPDGIYRDIYFPGLDKWLESNHDAVTFIPVLYNIKRSYFSAWRWFRRSKSSFINPYYYYKICDYVFAFVESWKQVLMPQGRIELGGMDVTGLFRSERARFAFDSLDTILYFRLSERLSRAGFKFDLLITEYENMINEKLLILGFRRYSPGTMIVGFQHGALYPLLLCNFVSQEEGEFAPLPDRIVSNGDFFRTVLIQKGMPEELIVSGPALRYDYVHNIPLQEAVIDMLVILPLMKKDAVELFFKTIEAFKNRQDLRIAVKPHSMMSRDDIIRSIPSGIPVNFRFVEGKMKDWIGKTKIVIALSSSTIYEALAVGVPVVVVGREAAINLNPLAFFEDLKQVFYSPDDIRKEALRMLSLSPEDLQSYKQRGKKIIRESFNPVTDETMKAFVDSRYGSNRMVRCR